MTTLSNQEVLAELYYTQKAIKMVSGVTPLHWRPVSIQTDRLKLLLLTLLFAPLRLSVMSMIVFDGSLPNST